MKYFNKIMLTLKLLFLIVLTSVTAQENGALDRVPEVEAELRKDIIDHVARLIPKESFSVSVKIIPLKRESASKTQADILPFYESSSEPDFTEEWEDPTTSYYVLLSRVKQVVVNLSVDKAYALKNESDFKDNLFKSVGLITGRDQLEIKMVEIQSFTKITSIDDFNWLYILGATFFILFFIATFVLFNKLINSKNSSRLNQESTQSQIPSIIPPSVTSTLKPNFTKSSNELNSINGDITFTDSLKLNSYLKEKIHTLTSKKSFPTLSMLKTLEDFLEIDSMGFSYLMSQFPEDSKKNIYSHGRTQNWIKAFSQSGLATKNVLLYMDRLLQCHPLSNEKELETLFINTWRLGLQVKEFITVTTSDEAKFLLCNMPKSLSLPIARNIFPGEWAFLFSDKKTAHILSDIRIKELNELANKIKPLFQVELITFYNNQEELISFLKQCNPEEERDIYHSYKGSPSLHELRSPFYAFFELETPERVSIFRKFDIRSWALATFNISRELRAKIDELMNDKEKFLFKTYLVELDKNRPTQDQISQTREAIAELANEKYLLLKKDNNDLYSNEGLNEKAA